MGFERFERILRLSVFREREMAGLMVGFRILVYLNKGPKPGLFKFP